MRILIKSFFAVMLLLAFKRTVAQQTGSTSEFKREFLENINHVRQKGCNCGTAHMAPAPPLVWNDRLEIAALGHAADMSKNNYFSHTGRNGRTSDQRMVAAGYGYNGFKSFAVGENIAQGQMSIAEVMAGWFKSPGHCKNLMNPEFKEVGVAKYNDYWVQDFGGRVPFSEEEQKLLKSGRAKLIRN
ncbi:CAP domain-containing protein [Mucilaginibacter sp. L3T2-6]|uniref:CAP domain-containing protein n=1 Tax=Mucilaginibacter sp. L3T2-6 TaxID=3062491 RepID=UPI002675EC06|nr:CAP domain-containing protein [Mucilaginibacter sp. L3T2-6]MDO3641081.1 CAP domain-containing protein [Mucilaginibacter sp. L3T2-6]MDV6213443.1 CAP domain-containing protein [Mucilaginibacter sp. L3T2-6]